MKRARATHVIDVYNYNVRHTREWMRLVREYRGDAPRELWRLYCDVVHGSLQNLPEALTFDADARDGIMLSTPTCVYVVECGGRVAYLTVENGKHDWPVGDMDIWPYTACNRAFVSPCADVWTLICAQLNVYELLALGCTCKNLNQLIRRNRIWQQRHCELQACVPAINVFAKLDEPLHRVYARLVNYSDKKRAVYNAAYMPLLLALNVPCGLQAPFTQINGNYAWKSTGFLLRVRHNASTNKIDVSYAHEHSRRPVPFRPFKYALRALLRSTQGSIRQSLVHASVFRQWAFFKEQCF